MSSATNRWRNRKTSSVPHANASVAQSEMRHAALCITGLSVFDDITHASQSSNQRLLSAPVHLSAQPVNMHIHHVGVRLNSHAPHLVQDHGARHYAARIPAKVFQQNELLRCQLQRLP